VTAQQVPRLAGQALAAAPALLAAAAAAAGSAGVLRCASMVCMHLEAASPYYHTAPFDQPPPHTDCLPCHAAAHCQGWEGHSQGADQDLRMKTGIRGCGLGEEEVPWELRHRSAVHRGHGNRLCSHPRSACVPYKHKHSFSSRTWGAKDAFHW